MKRSYSSRVTSFDSSERLNQKDWLLPKEVAEIFKTIRDPNSVIHFLERYSLRKDYKPTEQLYTVVIKTLSQAKMFDEIHDIMTTIKSENRCSLSDEFFYILVKIYGNAAGDVGKAVKTLFDMPKVYNCWPSIKTFNCVLNMLVNTKQFDAVHQVYYLGASQLGLEFDTCCFNILIKGLCNWDKLDKAFELLDEIPKQGRRPNAKTYSTLMSCLCKHGRVDEAFELFERMEREGCYLDAVIFNILISGLCKQGRVTEGIELFSRMNLKGCEADLGSYQAVLYGLLDSKQYVEGKSFMLKMVSEGKFPSYQSYKMVIQGLCSQNLLEDVDLVLKQMNTLWIFTLPFMLSLTGVVAPILSFQALLCLQFYLRLEENPLNSGEKARNYVTHTIGISMGTALWQDLWHKFGILKDYFSSTSYDSYPFWKASNLVFNGKWVILQHIRYAIEDIVAKLPAVLKDNTAVDKM
ncbi:hypothetical protein GIB67_010610 [Kingdonia uniflora]|uniref:Pentatricopeptide repeat-containing protein n=1 Tax=Kingdonia uniflora TaxID=39325 RepID=A0A7J7MAW5_9MAGN|nr:hypothetical protein GIB67_010610 [Kingdonia uniflora]